MKYCFQIAALFTCLLCAAGEKPPKDAPKGPTKHDMKLAQKEFQHALELQKAGRTEEAFQEAGRAVELAPNDQQFLTARELLRGQLAGSYIQRGNLLAEIGDKQGAAAQYQLAINIDPQNGYAQERLQNISPPPVDAEREQVLQLLASVEQIEVTPKPGKRSFHLRGETRDVYQAIAKAFEVTILFDEPLNSQRVRFDVDDIDFQAVMRLAGRMTKTFWAPIAANEAIVANETQDLHRQFDRLSLKTFYVSASASVQDLNDIVNVLRTVFDIKFVSMEAAKNTITVRAPRATLDAASAMLEDLLQGRPEVLLDIKAYEVSSSFNRQTGMNLPTNFQVFNIPTEVRKILGPVSQDVIDQIIRTGTVDPTKVSSGSLSSLASSPLLLPFIFFGKGLGLTGVGVSPVSATASANSSSFRSLEHVTMRAQQGNAATFRLGTRLPIQTSSFTNISIDRNGRPATGNAIPGIQYEDIGLTFKATPRIHADDEISMDLDLQMKSAGAVQLNGVPIISNRSYIGSITVRDGEPSIITGMLTEQVDSTAGGLPAVGSVPGVRDVLTNKTKARSQGQILIVITPHIIRRPYHKPGSGMYWNVGQ
jgi:type II secretory pathway component GspD/PulD (secretin)